MTLNGGDVKAMRAHMDGQTGVYGRSDGVRSGEQYAVLYTGSTCVIYGQYCVTHGRIYTYVYT